MKRQLVYVAVLVLGLIIYYERSQHGSTAVAAHAVMEPEGLNPWAVRLLIIGLVVFVAGWAFSPKRKKKSVTSHSQMSDDAGEKPGT